MAYEEKGGGKKEGGWERRRWEVGFMLWCNFMEVVMWWCCLHLTGDVNTKAPYWPGKRTIELTVCLFFIMLVDMTIKSHATFTWTTGRLVEGSSMVFLSLLLRWCVLIWRKVHFWKGQWRDAKRLVRSYTCVPVNLTCVPNLDVLACSHKSTHHNNHGAAPWCRLKRVPCFQMTLRLMLNWGDASVRFRIKHTAPSGGSRSHRFQRLTFRLC